MPFAPRARVSRSQLALATRAFLIQDTLPLHSATAWAFSAQTLPTRQRRVLSPLTIPAYKAVGGPAWLAGAYCLKGEYRRRRQFWPLSLREGLGVLRPNSPYSSEASIVAPDDSRL